MVDPTKTPETNDPIETDDGQSSFWASQSQTQAPPLEPISPEAKKKRLMITGGILFFIVTIILLATAPKRPYQRPLPSPTIQPSPTPIPLSNGLTQEFTKIDQKLDQTDLQKIIAPPQVDMQLEF